MHPPMEIFGIVAEPADQPVKMQRADQNKSRSDGTRRALMQAAEMLWSKRDFDSVPVEEICVLAGVAKGTFYVHFPRKEYLLVMIVYSRILPREADLLDLMGSDLSTFAICDQVARTIIPRVRSLDKQLVRRAVEESFGVATRQIDTVRGGDRNLARYFFPVLRRGIDRGEIASGWNMEMVAYMLAWAIRQGILAWSAGYFGDESFERELRARVEIVLNGARQPSALAV